MRVLLVQPGKRDKRLAAPFGYVEPLGLESIAGAINDICDVDFIDMRFSSPSDFEKMIASENVEACGVGSSFTIDYNQAISDARMIKQIDDRIFVFVGGHHPSLRPQDFNLPFIDAVVIGEGEQTARELVTCLKDSGDLRSVRGLALNLKEGQFITPAREPIKDLDALPVPDSAVVSRFRRRYRLFTERSVTSLESMRGCQFKCNFCSVWKFYNEKVRMKSPKRVVDEIKGVPTENVFFVDDNFFASARRAEKIAELIKSEGIRKKFLIQARSDIIASNHRLIEKWADVGLRSAFLGFEKISQEGLDSVEKHNSVENNEKALEILKGYGIDPVVSFIVDPDYGKNEFLQLQKYVRKLSLRLPFFTMLTPLPGTDLYERLGKEMTCDDYDFFDLLHLVLPTRLPTEEFCRQFAQLYKTGYSTTKAIAGALLIFIDVLRGKLDFSEWTDIVGDWRIVTNPAEYLKWLSPQSTGIAAKD